MPDEEIVGAPDDASCCLPIEDLHAEPEESNPPPPFEAMIRTEPDIYEKGDIIT